MRPVKDQWLGRRGLFLVLILGGIALGGTGGIHAAGETGMVVVAGQGASSQEEESSVPWFRKQWAYGLYGAAAVGFVFLFVEWRTAFLERKRRELERLVQKRTREVELQKRQLEIYNRELLRSNEVLRETIEEKSRILGMAAHDLKNPLFGIQALSEIILEAETLSESDERKVSLILESAEEGLHLIDNLLTSAASSASEESEHQEVDLASLAQWVVRSFEPQADRKEQALHCRVAADEPCIVAGDKQRLREALSNLVSNALKYSPSGEDVEVVVDRDEEDVWVAVIDAGPGLSASDQKRMFAPFQRLSPEPTGGEGSSGLGLYIVKQIVDRHEGRIDVDSAPGEGSTFTLVLPAISTDPSSASQIEPTDVEEQMA